MAGVQGPDGQPRRLQPLDGQPRRRAVTAQDPVGNPLSVSGCATRQPGYFTPAGCSSSSWPATASMSFTPFDHPPIARFALPRRLNQPTRRVPAEASATVCRCASAVPGRGTASPGRTGRGGRVVCVEGRGLRAPIAAAACCRRSGLRPVRMTSAPSAQARRAAASPMPALPPITAMACPARSGLRWLETSSGCAGHGSSGGWPRRRVTAPPTVLASTEPTHRCRGQG
jgi:hypothetical protein